jgi:hypothetical protein
VVLVEGAVAAALVAALAVCVFLGLRAYGAFKSLKADADRFRGEVEPLVREMAAMAESAAGKAQRLTGHLEAIQGIVAR